MKIRNTIAVLALSLAGAVAQTNTAPGLAQLPIAKGLMYIGTPTQTVQKPFLLPDPLITTSGKRYDSTKFVRAYPSEICIRCAGPGNTLVLENVKLSDLSEDLQKHFQYDQKKAAAYDAKQKERSEVFKGTAGSSLTASEQQWRDYNNVIDRRIDEAKREIKRLELEEKIYQESLKERAVAAQEEQARAATIQALNPTIINQSQTTIIGR